MIKLEVLNSNGQLFRTLYTGSTNSGRHSTSIPLNFIPSGDYIFRVQHRPLFDPVYGNYSQGWRQTDFPFSVALTANIEGPTHPQRYTTSNFTAVTNAQNATYSWDIMPMCCTDEDNCGVFGNAGNTCSLTVYNTGYHYLLRLIVTDGVNRTAIDHQYVTVEYCIGGGGGNGCPTLAVESDSLIESGFTDENALLIKSPSKPDKDITDYYLVHSNLAPREGEINIKIHEPKTEHTWLDQVALMEAEVKNNEYVAVTDEGEVVNYTLPLLPFSVMLNDSVDVTEKLSARDNNMLEVMTGDELKIQLAENGHGDDIIIFDAGQTPIVVKDVMGSIVFSVPGSDEQDLGLFYLRPNKSTIALNMKDLTKGFLKVQFYHSALIDYLIIVRNLNTADVESLNIVSAEHSNVGSVLQSIIYEDQTYAEILPGENISFTFEEGRHTLPKVNHILKTVGRYETDSTFSLNKLAGTGDEELIPKENKLFDNYPNPFNPTTQIKYSVKENGVVTLKVYDVLGNEVSSLINEEKQAGTYTVTFNAGKLASGIYFYTITTKVFQQTKKMLLIK